MASSDEFILTSGKILEDVKGSNVWREESVIVSREAHDMTITPSETQGRNISFRIKPIGWIPFDVDCIAGISAPFE